MCSQGHIFIEQYNFTICLRIIIENHTRISSSKIRLCFGKRTPVLKQSPEVMTTTCHHLQIKVFQSNAPINEIIRDKIQHKNTFLANIKLIKSFQSPACTTNATFQHMFISISAYSLIHFFTWTKGRCQVFTSGPHSLFAASFFPPCKIKELSNQAMIT